MTTEATFLRGDTLSLINISQGSPSSINREKCYYSFINFQIVYQAGARGVTYLHGPSSNRSLSTNKLYEQGQFHEGLKDGEWRSWYASGNLKRIEHWKKGVRRGRSITYREDGTILLEGEYLKNGSFKPSLPKEKNKVAQDSSSQKAGRKNR